MNIKTLLTIALAAFSFFSTEAQKLVTLTEAVEVALNNNYDVVLSKNVVESSNQDEKYSIGLFAPDLSVNASQLWNRNDQKQILADNSERNRTGIRSDNLNASVQLNWILFDGSKMFITKRKYQQLSLLGELQLKNQINETVASIIKSYCGIVKEKQQLLTIAEQLEIDNERVKIAEKRLSLGFIVKPDLLQAKVDLNANRSKLIQQQIVINHLKEQFVFLLGNNIEKDFEVSDSIVVLGQAQQQITKYDRAERNPTLLIAKKSVEIAGLTLKEQKAEWKPVITFNSAYNFTRNNSNVVVNPYSPLFTQNRGFNYGFTASIPLFRGLDILKSIKLAEIDIRYKRLSHEREKALVEQNLNKSLYEYEQAKEILSIEEENLNLARENISIALETFRQGRSTSLKLRTAQISLAEGTSRWISAKYQLKVAETEILRLKGGLVKKIF